MRPWLSSGKQIHHDEGDESPFRNEPEERPTGGVRVDDPGVRVDRLDPPWLVSLSRVGRGCAITGC